MSWISSIAPERAEKEKIMEIRFTASIVEAIHFMNELVAGRQKVFPKDYSFAADDDLSSVLITLQRPRWSHLSRQFGFFGRIKATPIRETERFLQGGHLKGPGWRIQREVEFYLKGEFVARVHLVGEKYDGWNDDNDAMWNVSKIGYFRVWDRPPSDWFEFECKVSGLMGRLVHLDPSPVTPDMIPDVIGFRPSNYLIPYMVLEVKTVPLSWSKTILFMDTQLEFCRDVLERFMDDQLCREPFNRGRWTVTQKGGGRISHKPGSMEVIDLAAWGSTDFGDPDREVVLTLLKKVLPEGFQIVDELGNPR